MLANGYRPTIFYCNPNIYPEEEYLIRKNECTRYARALGLDIIDDDYDHEAWREGVKGLEDEPERAGRCLQCFRYRLLRSARYALSHGFPLLTTTLASSRWKSLEQINAAGSWAVETVLTEEGGAPRPEAGAQSAAGAKQEASALQWWDRNWRKGGLQERRGQIIKEQNFYNQLYCGCEFSMRNSQSFSNFVVDTPNN